MTTIYTKENKALIASSNFGPVRLKETISGAAAHLAGTIMGRITATGLLIPYLSGAVDGSEIPICVLLEDADASLADVSAVVGFAGVYVKANMIGLDAAAITALEPKAVYFK